MKSICLFIAFSLCFAFGARAESVGTLSEQLGAILNTDAVTKLEKGTSARELIEEKYLKEHGVEKVDDDFQYVEYASDIPEADGTTIGTATPGAAQNFLLSVSDQYLKVDKDGTELNKKELEDVKLKIKGLMKKLRAAGAEFGFDSNGSSACGVNYTTLYVIDVEEKTIHEFIFVTGPC